MNSFAPVSSGTETLVRINSHRRVLSPLPIEQIRRVNNILVTQKLFTFHQLKRAEHFCPALS